MSTALHCIVFALAQFRDTEPDVYPWVLFLKNGDRIVGYIDVPNWKDEDMVQIRIDEPWKAPGLPPKKPGLATAKIDLDNSDPESWRNWRTRHREEWEKVGYENVGTDENMYFVSKDEIDLAKRATDMVEAAALNEPGSAENIKAQSQSADSKASIAAAENTGSSFVRSWGPHLLILVVAGGLASLVVFKLLLK